MPNEQIVLYTNPMSRGRIARWIADSAHAELESDYVAQKQSESEH